MGTYSALYTYSFSTIAFQFQFQFMLDESICDYSDEPTYLIRWFPMAGCGCRKYLGPGFGPGSVSLSRGSFSSSFQRLCVMRNIAKIKKKKKWWQSFAFRAVVLQIESFVANYLLWLLDNQNDEDGDRSNNISGRHHTCHQLNIYQTEDGLSQT